MATALMRSIHTRLDRPALIDDPWGDRLVLDAEREAMRALVAPGVDLDATLRAHPVYGTVILRTRYSEDALQDAVARGTRQYVVVGAGMDSFALRLPPFASEVEVFEVDHPTTQEFKLRRMSELGIPLPPGLQLVAVDLGEVGLGAALASSAFRSDRLAFFSWLGVTSYLTREANLATLEAIASSALPGSELVFTYIDQRVFDPDPESDALQEVRGTLASAGEAWVSGFHPGELEDVLGGVGLLLVEDLGPAELHARYCADRTDGLTPAPHIHVTHARVAD
jgi:methyltransferase (TIGR00027 family)